MRRRLCIACLATIFLVLSLPASAAGLATVVLKVSLPDGRHANMLVSQGGTGTIPVSDTVKLGLTPDSINLATQTVTLRITRISSGPDGKETVETLETLKAVVDQETTTRQVDPALTVKVVRIAP